MTIIKRHKLKINNFTFRLRIHVHVYGQTFTKLYKVHSHWKYINGVNYAIQILALKYKVNYPPIVPMN